MNGYFENGRAFIDIDVYGFSKKYKQQLKATIDTGFDGYLSLTFKEAFPLGLILIGTKSYILADGSTSHNLICLGTVVFGNKSFSIPIDIQTRGSILVGASFFRKLENEITIDYANERVEFKDTSTTRKEKKSTK